MKGVVQAFLIAAVLLTGSVAFAGQIVVDPNIAGCGQSGSGWDTDLGTDLGGNIDADPMFVDADGADNIYGTDDDDLHFSPSSPCIDAGINQLAGCDAPDIDDDGDVDLEDFAKLAANWLVGID